MTRYRFLLYGMVGLVGILIGGQHAAAQVPTAVTLNDPTSGSVTQGTPPTTSYWVRATGRVQGGSFTQWTKCDITVKIKRTTTGKPGDEYTWTSTVQATQGGGILHDYDTLQVTVASDVPEDGDTYEVRTTAVFTAQDGTKVTKTAGPKTVTITIPAPPGPPGGT